MVEYLDPDIANEGLHAEAGWSPIVERARVPTYEGIKSIAKYFPQFSGRPYSHQTFPCWFYHPMLPKRLVEDKKQVNNDGDVVIIKKAHQIAAEELGCTYRDSTREEIAQGFPPRRWVYTKEWRAVPFDKDVKFDPTKPDTGKHIVDPGASSSKAIIDGLTAALAQNNSSIKAEDIATIIAATMAKLTVPARPPDTDADYEAFKAWKAEQSVVQSVGEPSRENPLGTPSANDHERDVLIAEAKRLNLGDGRTMRHWTVEQLRDAIEKVSQ